MGEACEQELGLMSINESGNKSDLVPPEGHNVSDSAQVTDLPTKGKFWASTSSIPASDSEPRILDQPPGPGNECVPKV